MSYYHRISEAIRFYQSRGYIWVDTPWIVPEEDKTATYPGLLERTNLGYLVGSAEQGFINLMRRGEIKPGLYVSAGPCFRFDDLDRPHHYPYFFKVELCRVLYNAPTLAEGSYVNILSDAKAFLGGEVVLTPDGADLELGGLEIGSYGRRKAPCGVEWVYGTGLAEPRYSEAVERHRNGY